MRAGCELAIQFHAVSHVVNKLGSGSAAKLDMFCWGLNAGCELGADWPSLHHEMSRSVTCDYRIAGCEPGADWF